MQNVNNSDPDLHSALSQLPAPDNRKLKMSHTVAIFANSAGIPDQNTEFWSSCEIFPETTSPSRAVKWRMRSLSGLVRAVITIKTL